jgi:hypothetical protein
MSSKKIISSLRVRGIMPIPKPLEETQFCQLANEFPRVPPEVYHMLELKHPQMHDCFKTSSPYIETTSFLANKLLSPAPIVCVQPIFFKK